MSKASELLQEVNKLYGSEQLQDDMQTEADKIFDLVRKQVQKVSSKLKKKHNLPKDAQVRTFQDGVKDIDFALELFVSYLLQGDEFANLDLDYE